MPNNIFLYYLDYEVQTLFGLDDPRQFKTDTVYQCAKIITKLAILLCQDTLILPASNYLESDLGFNLLNEMNPANYSDDVLFELASSSYNLTELLEKKKKEHGDEIRRIGYHYSDFIDSDTGIVLPGILIKRDRSASIDIKKAWMSEEGRHKLGEIIYNRFPHLYHAGELDQLIGDIPEKLGERAYLSRYITPFFRVPQGDNKFANEINCFITREYIRSFLDEFKATCISEIPMFNAELILPIEEKYQHLSFKKYQQLLKNSSFRGDSAWKYVKQCNTEQLIVFKSSDCWRRIMQPSRYIASMVIDTEAKEMSTDLNGKLLKQAEYREAVLENLKTFWREKGPAIIEKYKPQLTMPKSSRMDPNEFEKRVAKCKVLIMSANAVEGVVILNRLLLLSSESELKDYVYEGCLFTIATIKDVPIVHVWPLDTAAFTQYGSFKAADLALEYFTPDYVISVGVAFGIDPKPKKQKLGDVLISRELVFYDNFNKVTDGEIKLNAHETYRIDKNLEAQLHVLLFPNKFDYKWHYGTLLTGGTVLSDANERNKLVEAAQGIGHKIVGGEMEASGIYYACQKIKDRKVPFLVVKGICDWGAVKNGWEEVIKEPGYDNDEVKDCVQAYACNNAFDTVCKIFEHLNFTT